MERDEDELAKVHEEIHDAVEQQILPIAQLLMAPAGASNYGLSNTFTLDDGNEYRFNFSVKQVQGGAGE